jgi:hypothetical protein
MHSKFYNIYDTTFFQGKLKRRRNVRKAVKDVNTSDNFLHVVLVFISGQLY